MGEGKGMNVKGIFLGCFGSFLFLLGGCIDIAWRMERRIGDLTERRVAGRKTAAEGQVWENIETCSHRVYQSMRYLSGATRSMGQHVSYENARSIVKLQDVSSAGRKIHHPS
jgi:molybdate-binding protein